jgi:hypothetical protein
MKELQIVEKANSWVGRTMNWVSQSSGKSNLLAALNDAGKAPQCGFEASEDWSLVCFEMPLLASLSVNAMTQWYTKKVIMEPEHYLKGHELRRYEAGNALQGDLVFWKHKQQATKLLKLFDKGGGDDTGAPFGLDHVALATGKRRGSKSEVVSFWSSNKVESTTVEDITSQVREQFNNAEFEVTVARGPWYWGYYLW